MSELIVLLCLGAVAWFWADSMRAREAARGYGQQACRREGVQFLDDTVVLAKLRLRRNHDGNVRIHRIYRFEFSDTGDNRRDGSVALMGQRMETLEMEPHRAPAEDLRERVVIPFPSTSCRSSCGCGDRGERNC